MTKVRFGLILGLMLTAVGASFAQTTWKRVSLFKFGWDGHENVTVVLEIPTTWNDPGDFTRIRILVPGKKDFVLDNKDGWVGYRAKEASASPEILRAKNLVQSQHVLTLKVADGRTVLFLLGYSYASSPAVWISSDS